MALFDKGMVSEGYVVEARQIEVAIAKLPARFKSYTDLAVLLAGEGVPSAATARAADRILQRMRKAGLVSFAKGWWTRVDGRSSI